MAEYFIKSAAYLPDPALDASALCGIPAERQEYILKYRNAADRKLGVGAWRLMEEVLGGYGFSAKNVVYAESGKPLCEGICFNLSHSVDMVLCAVSSAAVGCDIERVENAPFEIIDKVFCPNERKYLSEAQSEEDKARRFFKLWTMKESYIKMTGEGFSADLLGIEVDPERLTVIRDKIIARCRLFNRSYGDYEIAVCEEM